MKEVTRKLISIEAAADYVGLNPRTIRRYIALGKLRAYRVGGTLIRVGQADVDALITPVPAAEVPTKASSSRDGAPIDAALARAVIRCHQCGTEAHPAEARHWLHLSNRQGRLFDWKDAPAPTGPSLSVDICSWACAGIYVLAQEFAAGVR